MTNDDDLDRILDQLPASQRERWLKGEPIGKPVAIKATQKQPTKFPITVAIFKGVKLVLVYSIWLVGAVLKGIGEALVIATENSVHYKLKG